MYSEMNPPQSLQRGARVGSAAEAFRSTLMAPLGFESGSVGAELHAAVTVCSPAERGRAGAWHS